MLIIYHANCMDGFCAAWLLHKLHPNAEFIPMNYGQSPPDVSGKNVIIADFSFKRPILLEMKEKAQSLLVLDHHKTAQADLEGLDFCVFDMNKSGARIVQDFYQFSPTKLVDYTEDRDLWRWKLLQSKEVNASLASYPKDFAIWDNLEDRLKENFISIVQEGMAILRYQDQVAKDHYSKPVLVTIRGHQVHCVNATTLFSDIAGKLAEGMPFGVAWFRRQDGKYQFSLRSRNEAVDVSEIAKSFGGGGHRNAAGFEAESLESVFGT
jgi:oligoribonuclease NrnB/cAMP/cGMP phosphodiesterase (DHH superfamily)